MKTPPALGSCQDICSMISVAGVIGYPAKKRQPARSAPLTQASFPCKRICSFLLFFFIPRHHYGKIGTSYLTPVASLTLFGVFHKGVAIFPCTQNIMGTKGNTDAAFLASALIDSHTVLHSSKHGLSQKYYNPTLRSIVHHSFMVTNQPGTPYHRFSLGRTFGCFSDLC